MRGMAEAVAGWLLRLRETSAPQLVLRGGVLLMGMAVLGLLWVWVPFFFAPVLAGFGALLVAAAVVSPDSLAATGVVVVVVLWWLMAGSDVGILFAAVVAGALALFHLASSWSALGPNHAGVSRAVAGRMAALAVGYLATVLVLIGLVVGVSQVGTPPVGTLWIAIGGASVVLVASAAVRRR